MSVSRSPGLTYAGGMLRVFCLLQVPMLFMLTMAMPLVAETWTAELGLSGLVVPGTWAPLRVDVDASWGPWSLEVERPSVRPGGRAVEVFQRSAGGHLEAAILIPEDADTLIVRAVVDGQVRAERTLSVGPKGFPGHIIGMAGLPAGAQRALANVLEASEPVRVVDLPTRFWPTEPLAWQGLSALALADPGPVLSPAQVRALRSWLDHGGHLVLVAPRAMPNSLSSQVQPAGSGTSIVGWGTLVRWDVATTDRTLLSSEAWGTQLGLVPFQEQPSVLRALVANASSPRPGSEPGAPELPPWLLPAATLWVAGCGLLMLRRKGPSSWALGLTSLAWAAVAGAFLCGNLPLDRGIVTQERLVVLPGGEALGWGTVGAQQRAPWGWSTLWDQQPLSVDPEVGVRLTHLAEPPVGASERTLGSTGPLRAGWTGWVTSADVTRLDLGQATYRLRVSQGRTHWSALSDHRWLALEQVPNSLKPHELWLRRVALAHPAEVWDVGQGPRALVWLRPAGTEASL